MRPVVFKSYLCFATELTHEFMGNADPERVPNQWGFHVCKSHLAEVNKCRRDKGLEELTAGVDAYPPTRRIAEEPDHEPDAAI